MVSIAASTTPSPTPAMGWPRTVPTWCRRRLPLSPVRLCPAEHPDDGDAGTAVINPVDHSVGATACAAAIVKGRPQLLADPVRVIEQWTDDEFVCGEGHRFRKLFGELPSRGRGYEQAESLRGHFAARRAFMAAARLS